MKINPPATTSNALMYYEFCRFNRIPLRGFTYIFFIENISFSTLQNHIYFWINKILFPPVRSKLVEHLSVCEIALNRATSWSKWLVERYYKNLQFKDQKTNIFEFKCNIFRVFMMHIFKIRTREESKNSNWRNCKQKKLPMFPYTE